jgi:phage replication-related protein YjqB (UPF0714/DUF867 family)
MSNNEGPFFTPHFGMDSGLADEHCKANLKQIRDIGRHRHEQVRIEFPKKGGGFISALYTVSVFHPNEDSVILGSKISELFEECELDPTCGICKGKVKAKIMLDGLDEHEQEAKHMGELVEYLSPEVQNRKLIVIAPHGGHIEPGTDDQGEYVWSHLSQLSPNNVTLWMCKGFRNPNSTVDLDAHKRWHITATEISERSFPKLKTIIEPKFEYAIAFHGWNDDFICVGGNAESIEAHLIEQIRDKIKKKLDELSADIKVVATSCGGGFGGDDPCNIVNRLGVKGIQIEQCKKAREEENFRDAIAQAVVEVIEPKINA